MYRDVQGSMARIESRIDIKSTVDMVWAVVSDIDNEPKFWKGTKKVRNISRNENTVKREVTIAFRDQKCLQTVSMTPNREIKAIFTKGVIEGTKTLTLTPDGKNTILEVVWDIRLTGMMGLFTGMIKKHIKSGTEQVIQNIKNETER